MTGVDFLGITIRGVLKQILFYMKEADVQASLAFVNL